MLRINDPAGVHTVQQGLGCSALGGPNCSPDTRFGANIGEGYTVAFNTGMPACIPRSAADALCPASNRTANKVVADSTRFAPIQVGDNLFATGNYETVNLVTFMSAWSVQVFDKLTTQNTPTQPDYVHISTARWEVPGFPSNRIRVQFVTGSGTDPQPVGARHHRPHPAPKGAEPRSRRPQHERRGDTDRPVPGACGRSLPRVC